MQHRFDCVVLEEGNERAFVVRHAWPLRGQAVHRVEPAFTELLLQRFDRGRLREVRGDANTQRVEPFDACSREREPGADLELEARKEPTATDVGEEADRRLGHREHGALGGDAMTAVHADAHVRPSSPRRAARRLASGTTAAGD